MKSTRKIFANTIETMIAIHLLRKGIWFTIPFNHSDELITRTLLEEPTTRFARWLAKAYLKLKSDEKSKRLTERDMGYHKRK